MIYILPIEVCVLYGYLTSFHFYFLLIRFEKLKPEVAKRKTRLTDSLHFHQFRFDVDEELQWIKERLPAAASTEYGKSLTDAQNLQKKQQVCFRLPLLKFL